MRIYALLAIVIVVWLVSTLISATALVFAIMQPRHRFRLLLIFASASIVVSYLGFGRGTPLSFFPQIVYTWASGGFQISISSSWFFLVPLALGMTALLMGFGNRRRLSHAC